MYPDFIHIGTVTISSFGVMMMLAFLVAYFQLRWGLSKLEIGNSEDAHAIVLAAAIGGIIGAKLYYAALYRDWRLIFDRSGLVWYGGFVLAVIAVVWVAKRRNLPGWRTTDAAAPALALGYGVGRIGCFLVGDDFGMPTALPWGVSFPRGLPGPTTAGLMRDLYGADIPWDVANHELVAVHPTQLYETALAFTICWIGVVMIRRQAPVGSVTLTLIGLLAIERFLVEFLRAKDDRLLGGFTVAQAISVGVVATDMILALLSSRGEAANET